MDQNLIPPVAISHTALSYGQVQVNEIPHYDGSQEYNVQMSNQHHQSQRMSHSSLANAGIHNIAGNNIHGGYFTTENFTVPTYHHGSQQQLGSQNMSHIHYPYGYSTACLNEHCIPQVASCFSFFI